MFLLLSASGDDAGLADELKRHGLSAHLQFPGLLALEGLADSEWPVLALARQAFPDAVAADAPSVNAWARILFDSVSNGLPDSQPWHLHVGSHYGVQREERIGARAWHSVTRHGESARSALAGKPFLTAPAPAAGVHRCGLIRTALLGLLKEKRRHLLRQLRADAVPFTSDDSLVQLLLTSPDHGWLSVSRAPQPHTLRRLISPFPKGEIPVASDKAAPSRAFAKLVEAELRFGRRLVPNETCVDLGASPGGWSYVARQRGANVIAVDRSPLRDDLMADPGVTFVRGDAFAYEPERTVDWLVCDVIAAPERTVELVLEWARRRWARHLVVTIKLRGGDHAKLDRLKDELPALMDEWFLTHLCANKHEACVFGTVRDSGL